MTALGNILADLVFQWRIRGGLWARLVCVAAYYFLYGWRRLLGLARGESRLGAIADLRRAGFMARTIQVRWPGEMRLEADLFTASFMIKEMCVDRMYQHVPGFSPRPGQTVVDVGSHQGLYTLLAAGLVGPGGRVIAIEPLAENIRLLGKNLRGNGLSQVSVVGLAAADFQGEADFYVLDLLTAGSLVIRREGFPTLKVSTDTLDHILEELGISRVDLIKIDVEGACLKVLDGARRTLGQKPRLVMEVEGGDEELERVRRYMDGLGYRTEPVGSIVYAEALQEGASLPGS